MIEKSQLSLPSKLYAEAIVRSISGKSLLGCDGLITSDHVDDFYADPDLCNTAVERLLKAGFEILTIGKISISIVAKTEVYEQAFNTTLEAKERTVLKSLGRREPATFINALDTKPFGEIDTSITSWNDVLEGVAINEPSYYFATETPSTLPPTITKKYLSVPDGVVQGLNAIPVHQQGINGKGIRVVMIDTGWYPHPFFYQNNFKVIPVLAPGTSNRFQDEHGHGTGESANILAVAPEVDLIMVKAGTVVDGKHKNVSSIAAFETAIALNPTIISCSWGSDMRSSELSPSDRALAAIISRAVKKGIIVVFSAGNGHWGFPGQHPDVISVGGVHKYLEGELEGQLEASNYASSFVSPVYPDRFVPDVCGLVGQLPHATYIMLPVPPSSQMDRDLASVHDGTNDIDGWAAFSGTSAAAPQIAGICALIKQVAPKLSPPQVRYVLRKSARDVIAGSSNPASGGASAGVGRDLATGYGLVDAAAAVKLARELDTGQCCDNCESQSQSFSISSITSSNPQNNQRRQTMSSEFPNLKTKIDEIQSRLDEVLRTEFINNDLVENVELQISEDNFVKRSAQTDAILALVNSLKALKLPSKNLSKVQTVPTSETPDEKTAREAAEKAKIDAIKKKHVFAAKSLLKVQKHKELATQVLITAMNCSDEEVSEKAIEALGEFGKEINIEFSDINSFADTCEPPDKNGNVWCKTESGAWFKK